MNCAFYPCNSGVYRVRGPGPQRGILLPRATGRFPLNYKVWLPPEEFRQLVSWAGKKRCHCLCPERPEEVNLLLYKGDREEYVWNPDDPLGCFLVLSFTIVITNGQTTTLRNLSLRIHFFPQQDSFSLF